MKYPLGTKLICNDIRGEVVSSEKQQFFPDDVCVQWEQLDFVCSYDEWWLDENAKVIE